MSDLHEYTKTLGIDADVEPFLTQPIERAVLDELDENKRRATELELEYVEAKRAGDDERARKLQQERDAIPSQPFRRELVQIAERVGKQRADLEGGALDLALKSEALPVCDLCGQRHDPEKWPHRSLLGGCSVCAADEATTILQLTPMRTVKAGKGAAHFSSSKDPNHVASAAQAHAVASGNRRAGDVTPGQTIRARNDAPGFIRERLGSEGLWTMQCAIDRARYDAFEFIVSLRGLLQELEREV